MGKIAAIPLLFFVGLSAVVKAQAGVTTITDFTVLVEKKTSLWENFFFNVNDDTGEQYFCSTPFDVRLNSDGNRDESTFECSKNLNDKKTDNKLSVTIDLPLPKISLTQNDGKPGAEVGELIGILPMKLTLFDAKSDETLTAEVKYPLSRFEHDSSAHPRVHIFEAAEPYAVFWGSDPN